MRSHKQLLGGIAAIILSAGAAAADNLSNLNQAQIATKRAYITAADPNGMLAAMRSFGMMGSIKKDSVGDPMIESRTSESNFTVRFYNCTEGVNCGSVQFRASYRLDGPVSSNATNSWNQTKLYGRAYVTDEGYPVVEHVVSMHQDGVGPENFEWILGTWAEVVAEFETYVGYR